MKEDVQKFLSEYDRELESAKESQNLQQQSKQTQPPTSELEPQSTVEAVNEQFEDHQYSDHSETQPAHQHQQTPSPSQTYQQARPQGAPPRHGPPPSRGRGGPNRPAPSGKQGPPPQQRNQQPRPQGGPPQQAFPRQGYAPQGGRGVPAPNQIPASQNRRPKSPQFQEQGSYYESNDQQPYEYHQDVGDSSLEFSDSQYPSE
eukprot:TRINITY_DN2883_c0_g1_i1.p1 TRINITY_DN2883_c0_g1~~TRINITY_DN2883_c0_g1_i1.p1  ORF type:complete len:202 (+),score=70.64 TRINITY_DN2883_c0_g1_i1:567-1172(+)